jgi:hypothetical protein
MLKVVPILFSFLLLGLVLMGCQGLLLSGALNCENDSHCPEGQSCQADGLCASGGGNGSSNDGGGANGVTPTEAGQLIFTEIMIEAKASSQNFQYVELRNVSADTDFDLQNCALAANTDSVTNNQHVIADSTVILQGAYGSVADDADADAANAIYAWPREEFSITNFRRAGGILSLTCGGVLIDEVRRDFVLGTDGGAGETFEGFMIDQRSVALDKDILDEVQNDEPGNWCLETATYNLQGDIVQGSPGEENACNAI